MTLEAKWHTQDLSNLKVSNALKQQRVPKCGNGPTEGRGRTVAQQRSV